MRSTASYSREEQIEDTEPGDKPNIKELVAQLQDAARDSEDYYDRIQEGHDARFCLWDGQSDDGRKHEDAIGKEAFPWEGASDTRLRRVESIIHELKNTLMAAFHRGSFQATGVDQDADPIAAAQISPLLRYIFRNRMRTEIRNELNYLLNWMLTYGSSVLWVDWFQELRMEEKEVTLEQMQQVALEQAVQQAAAEAEEAGLNEKEAGILIQEAAIESQERLIEKIFSEEYRETAVAQLSEMTGVEKKVAGVMLDELAEEGVTSYPSPYVHTNQPRWTALRPGFDVFFPYDTDCLQTARFVARAEILTRAELEAKEVEEGWDPAFIKFMLEKGEGVLFNEGITYQIDPASSRGVLDRGSHTYADRIEEYKNQFQVFHFYYRGKDKKGFPVIYRTITSPLCNDEDDYYALHEINPYEHGMIPGIEFRREWFHRPILESRGVAELAWTAQNELKTHRDAQIDQASITVNPPLIMPRQRSGVPIVFGPGRQIPEHRAQTMRWMDPPKNDGRAEMASEMIEADLALYWGLQRDVVPPDLVVLYKMVLTEDFLTSMGECLTMTVALLQQYMDPMMISRVTNAPPQEISAEDIRGRYDIAYEFDPRDLLGEQMDMKIKFFEAITKFDTTGILDRAQMVREIAASWSPNMAERIVKDPQQAEQDEVSDEKLALSQMQSGVEPLMIEGGQNHALRAQVLQADIQKNPQLQQQYAQDEIFKAMVDARLQHHQFQVQQEQNAQIGRLGAESALPIQGNEMTG